MKLDTRGYSSKIIKATFPVRESVNSTSFQPLVRMFVLNRILPRCCLWIILFSSWVLFIDAHLIHSSCKDMKQWDTTDGTLRSLGDKTKIVQKALEESYLMADETSELMKMDGSEWDQRRTEKMFVALQGLHEEGPITTDPGWNVVQGRTLAFLESLP